MMRGFLLLTAGLLLSALAATVAVAAATVSQLQLARWVQTRLRGAGQVASLRENPSRLLATANAITTIGLILAAAALPAMLAHTTPTFLGLFTFFVAVPVLVSVAYLVPRVMGRRWAESIVAWSLPWFERLERLVGPFVPSRSTSNPRSALAAALTDVDTQALASSDEMAVVSGVLAFSDRPVRELMTPRTAIVAIPEGMLAGEAAHVFAQAGYSRYPVHRGSLDDIAGVVHIFDLLRVPPDEPVPVRPTLVIPGTLRAADLMLRMQRGGGHLAVVLDEHGGTAGLVTFDDLLRDLVAEVFGEGPPADPAAATTTPRLLEIEGNAPLARVAEAFGTSIGAWGVQTVGGFLIQAVGRIPRSGERFTVSGLEFDVLQASPTRVERVAVRVGPVRAVALDQPPPAPPSPPAPEGGRA